MHQNKLILSLLSFDRKEMTRFKEFCHSPYFNKHERVRKLVQYLSDIYPRFDARGCDRYLLFDKIFDEKGFDQGKLSVVFTYAQRCLEQFLTLEQFQNEEIKQKIFLLRKLMYKRDYTAFERLLPKLGKKHKNTSLRNADFYFHSYLLAKHADDYYNLIDRRRVDDSLEEKQKNLNLFFLLEKLKDACEAKVRQNIMKVQYQDPWTELVLQEVKNNLVAYETYPAVLLYFQIYQMLINQEATKPYFRAFQSLENHLALFPKQELGHIYIYFMNYCISRINKGDSTFLKEVFKLYKAQLAQGLLYEDGFLSEWDYKNIVTTAIRLRELKWVFAFIEEYKHRLPADARENAYRFNLAAYHYANGTYGEVLNLLTRVEYSDLRYNLSAKALLLRTYYDLDEYEALVALTESFRQYLLRNKLMSDNRRLGFHNLFKTTRRMASLRQKAGYLSREKIRKELDKIQQEINGTDLLYNRDWLIEKWAELESLLAKRTPN